MNELRESDLSNEQRVWEAMMSQFDQHAKAVIAFVKCTKRVFCSTCCYLYSLLVSSVHVTTARRSAGDRRERTGAPAAGQPPLAVAAAVLAALQPVGVRVRLPEHERARARRGVPRVPAVRAARRAVPCGRRAAAAVRARRDRTRAARHAAGARSGYGTRLRLAYRLLSTPMYEYSTRSTTVRPTSMFITFTTHNDHKHRTCTTKLKGRVLFIVYCLFAYCLFVYLLLVLLIY